MPEHDTHAPKVRWWQGQMVTCWHPDSPGGLVTVWRPWWRKRRVFASSSEVLRSYRPTLDTTGRDRARRVLLEVLDAE